MTTDPESGDQPDAVEQRQRVREGYDDLAQAYADNREQDQEERELIDELVSRVEGSSPRILDAGCGDGRAASQPLAEHGAAVIGLDGSRSQLELATETLADPALTGSATTPPTLVQGDLTALPFERGTFTAVCALHSIIHVPRDEHATVLGEFARILKSGGWVLLTVGADGWEGSNPDWLDSGTEMRWSFHGVEWTRETLADAGFAVADEVTIDDELGDGEWRYLLAQRL